MDMVKAEKEYPRKNARTQGEPLQGRVPVRYWGTRQSPGSHSAPFSVRAEFPRLTLEDGVLPQGLRRPLLESLSIRCEAELEMPN